MSAYDECVGNPYTQKVTFRTSSDELTAGPEDRIGALETHNCVKCDGRTIGEDEQPDGSGATTVTDQVMRRSPPGNELLGKRFEKIEKRPHTCDECGRKYEGRVFDGRFTDPSWLAWCPAEHRLARWADCTINATWWCRECLAGNLGLETPEAHEELGILNVQARRKRTRYGSVRGNPCHE